MKLLKLNGKHATGEYAYCKVDDEDYEELSQYNWCVQKNIYYHFKGVKRKRNKPVYSVCISTKGKTYLIHRVILKLTDVNIKVDHINHDRLDNRKENLRFCNNSENARNRTPSGTSKYLGVSKLNKNGRYVSSITAFTNLRSIHLGYFKNEKEAAEIYDLAALKYHGEFANLNFPEKLEEYKILIKTIVFKHETIKNYSSKYTGVSWHKKANKWAMQIAMTHEYRKCCYFSDEILAAESFDYYKLIRDGENTELNFPENKDKYLEKIKNDHVL